MVRVRYVKPLRLFVRKRVGYIRPLRMRPYGVRVKVRIRFRREVSRPTIYARY